MAWTIVIVTIKKTPNICKTNYSLFTKNKETQADGVITVVGHPEVAPTKGASIIVNVLSKAYTEYSFLWPLPPSLPKEYFENVDF